MPQFRIAIRLPGRKYWVDMSFLHDTGASMMHIYEFDVDMLAVPLHAPHDTPARPMIIAQNTIYTLAGPRVYDIIEIEAAILDEKGRRMCPWERIPTAVSEGSWKPCLNERLDGPFTRGRFYTANVPDGDLSMQIANDKSSLKIKRIDPSEIKPLVYASSNMVPKPYPITSGHSSVPEDAQPSDKKSNDIF